VKDLSGLAEERVVVLDTGDNAAQLAIDLIEHTSRVVLMTTGKEPSVSPAVRSALRLSDVKVLAEAQPLELLGEGELERIRAHNLNEDEEYELTADAFVVLEQVDLHPCNRSTFNVGFFDQSKRKASRPRKTYRPEEIIAKLRKAEVLLGEGKKIAEVIKALGIHEVTFYRWRREYGGLSLPQAKRLKELERENLRRRRAVSDLTLDKLILA
jgi:putative transposase